MGCLWDESGIRFVFRILWDVVNMMERIFMRFYGIVFGMEYVRILWNVVGFCYNSTGSYWDCA